MTTAKPEFDVDSLLDIRPECDVQDGKEATWAAVFNFGCEHRLWLMCDAHAETYRQASAWGRRFGCPHCKTGPTGYLIRMNPL